MKTLLQTTVALDQAATMLAILRDAPPKTLGACLYSGELAKRFANGGHPVDAVIVGDLGRVPFANLRLLTRQVPALRGAEVRAVPLADEAAYPAFPNGEFRLGKGFDFTRVSEHARIVANPDRKARLLAYPAFLLRTCTRTLPRLLWARIRGT